MLSECKVNEDSRIIIAASGSGGHLFPAQFIAGKIREISPGAEVVFVGSGRPLEEKLIDGAGFRREVLPFEGLRAGGAGWIALMWRIPRALVATWKLFLRIRPDVVIGVGGYVSVVPVLVAWLRGVPSWIHEAEARAGKANRLLAHFAAGISVAFPDVDIPRKSRCVLTGHPLREELSVFSAEKASPPENPSRLLVLGGSQGARGLDEGMIGVAAFLKERGLDVRHQCRAESVEYVRGGYRRAGLEAEVIPFIDDMLDAYSWAHIIISRAGAGAVMELGVVGKPCILVPFPSAQGGHQKTNALVLVNQGKAVLCEEGPDFSDRLRTSLSLVLSKDRYSAMYCARSDTRSLNAAELIATGALHLAEKHRRTGLRAH